MFQGQYPLAEVGKASGMVTIIDSLLNLSIFEDKIEDDEDD